MQKKQESRITRDRSYVGGLFPAIATTGLSGVLLFFLRVTGSPQIVFPATNTKGKTPDAKVQGVIRIVS